MMTDSHSCKTICVSFSGVDGAGKSTQIDALRDAFEASGLRVTISRFWDDVARLTGLREASGHKIFKGEKGIGSPDKPINRRDKNVRSWPMSCVRLFIYTLDAFSTRTAVTHAKRSGADLFIFDRYLYDELANLNLANPLMRLYVKAVMMITPRPDISFVLDADPIAARARKPEYPIEFIQSNRQAYFDLSRILDGMTIISAMSISDVRHAILAHVLQLRSLRPKSEGKDDESPCNVSPDPPLSRPAA